jgi:hypothetical protein
MNARVNKFKKVERSGDKLWKACGKPLFFLSRLRERTTYGREAVSAKRGKYGNE